MAFSLPPIENSPQVFGRVPPDRQDDDLGGLLERALAIIAADRVLSPDEMRVLGAFFEGVQAVGRGRQMRAAGESEEPGVAAPTEDYMGHAGLSP